MSAALTAPAMIALVVLVEWPSLHMTGGWAVIALGAIAVSWLVNVAIHEGAHLLAATAVSFRPFAIAIGPLALSRKGSGWTPGLSQHSWLGGLVMAFPSDLHRVRRRLMIMIVAGPAATATVAAMSFVALRRAATSWGPLVSGADALWFVALAAFVGSSWFLLVTSLVPARVKRLRTDAAAVVHLLRNPDHLRHELASIVTGMESINGVRPAEWTDSHISSALRADPSTPHGAFSRLVAHWQAVDRGDADRAREMLTEAMTHQEALDEHGKRVMFLAAAFFAATYDRDGAAARGFMNQVLPGGTPTATYRVSFVEGVVRTAEGRADAAEALAEAERLLPEALEPGFARMDRDFLERLTLSGHAAAI